PWRSLPSPIPELGSRISVPPCTRQADIRTNEKARLRRAFCRSEPNGCVAQSVLDVRRELAAIGRELGHHLLVQPDIHGRGIIGVTGVAKLVSELLACAEAGIDVEGLHEVDDRGPPFELLALGLRSLVDDLRDIDTLGRGGGSR